MVDINVRPRPKALWELASDRRWRIRDNQGSTAESIFDTDTGNYKISDERIWNRNRLQSRWAVSGTGTALRRGH